jgi:hypothetical protein
VDDLVAPADDLRPGVVLRRGYFYRENGLCNLSVISTRAGFGLVKDSAKIPFVTVVENLAQQLTA